MQQQVQFEGVERQLGGQVVLVIVDGASPGICEGTKVCYGGREKFVYMIKVFGCHGSQIGPCPDRERSRLPFIFLSFGIDCQTEH